MSQHLQQDLDFLKKEIINIALMAEQATNKAILALVEQRTELAEEVLNEDDLIDRKEVQIEQECLDVLALHQPVAADLRFIITVIKVNNDIERIGDLAVNIAERAVSLSHHEHLPVFMDFPGMWDMVLDMLHHSLDSLATNNASLAREVLAMDDQVDDANREMLFKLQKLMQQDPENVERAVHLLSVSRNLERIGDLAANIAQDVVYMTQGKIIRHSSDGF